MLENERVGGPRQYTGVDSLGQLRVWKCPACGQDNQTPFAEGCPQCGNGKPGQHVGVDPVVTPEERARILAAQNQKKPDAKPVVFPTRGLADAAVPTQAEMAYSVWVDLVDAPRNEWTYRAFLAGWKIRGTKLQDSVTMELPELLPSADLLDENRPGDPAEEETPPPQFPPEQIRQRTLLAALRFFRGGVMAEAGEEVATGEWLAVADVDAWIVELEKELAQ